jgi:hypothetical protein
MTRIGRATRLSLARRDRSNCSCYRTLQLNVIVIFWDVGCGKICIMSDQVDECAHYLLIGVASEITRISLFVFFYSSAFSVYCSFSISRYLTFWITSSTLRDLFGWVVGTVFAYGVTSSGKSHTMHVSLSLRCSRFLAYRVSSSILRFVGIRHGDVVVKIQFDLFSLLHVYMFICS